MPHPRTSPGGAGRRLSVVLLLGAALAAGEAPPPPDPYGLGERLALIEALRDEFAQGTPPGCGLEELRARWAAAWAARAAAQAGPATTADPARERLVRQLRERYGLDEVPDLGTAELTALRDRLEREQQRRAAADGDAAPAAVGSAGAQAAPALPAVERTAAPRPAAPAPAAAASRRGRILDLRESGVSQALLIEAPKPALLVQFGGERAGEFSSIYPRLVALLDASPHIPSAVFLLGHGSGTQISGVAIDDHLRRNKAFYETFGGTRPAAPVACLVIASCAAGSPNQMQEIRDGLGYYPVWRVGTWSRSYANGLSVLGAFEGIHRRPADPPWRGLFLTGHADGTPASLGEVGRDGARGNLVYVDLVRDGGRQVWKPR